jgi:hypothetical protein
VHLKELQLLEKILTARNMKGLFMVYIRTNGRVLESAVKLSETAEGKEFLDQVRSITFPVTILFQIIRHRTARVS